MVDFGVVRAKRLPAAEAHLGSATRVALVNGNYVWHAARRGGYMIPAVNVRLQPGLAGIMRAAEEKGSALAVEAAMSEVCKQGADPAALKQGYSGMTPGQFARFVLETADQVGFTQPLVVHVDHTTVQKDTPEAIEAAREQIGLYLQDGIAGSFSVDASFLQPYRNTEVTADLARPIVDAELALEVEVGEIGNARSKALKKTAGREPTILEKLDQVTTVWEVVGPRDEVERVQFEQRYGRAPNELEQKGFIPALLEMQIFPDLLAIDNGSKHGNYKPGEEVSIFLGRTADVANAIAGYRIGIAQHGITGTPEDQIYRFIQAGIAKGNIGTEWQNQAHQHMDPEIHTAMVDWAKTGGHDIKLATKQFRPQLDAMAPRFVEAINQATYHRMLMYIEAFRCADSGPKIIEALAA